MPGQAARARWPWPGHVLQPGFLRALHRRSVSIPYNDSCASNHRAVACQETGDTFGMGHSDASNSCMWPMHPQGIDPDADDYTEITAVPYPR